MNSGDGLAKRFEESRGHLRAVAYRMLGSQAEADDAVQEAWLRLSRVDSAKVDNLGGWLTTVVARVSLDMLRSRKARREETDDVVARVAAPVDVEGDVVLADAVGPALLVVLEALKPAERVAFVLHDMFDLSFEEIAAILGRSPAASRQLASRARRRVRGESAVDVDEVRERRLVDAFLAASRDGDFPALLAVLAPDVVLHADHAAVSAAAQNGWVGMAPLTGEARGADAVARVLVGRARGVRRATIDGAAGAAWAHAGTVRSTFCFTLEGDRIVAIEIVMDGARLGAFEVALLD